MIDPKNVHDILARHQLTDGFPVVLDLGGSHGAWLRDARTGDEYLDCFTGFASWPIGFNHPMMDDPAFVEEIGAVARNNPANSDLYTSAMASFVDAFGSRVTPEAFKHHFWIAGGALAVENAMKVAFDWKARKLGRRDMLENVDDLVILHFRQAFHGRSGYTMSVTNTLPDKVGLFPRFPWPRVHNPYIVFDLDGAIANDVEAEEKRACAEIEHAFRVHGKRIAGILIEPMQGEGGDNHFRTEFLAQLRRYADEQEALLLFDEVQTGFFGSGKPWLWQHHGVEPDVVAFGKKTQVCGIYAGARVDQVKDNVFQRSSRINSTWGGSLTDMVRCRRLIEIIEAENLVENIVERGAQLVAGLRDIARDSGGLIEHVRGIGSLAAFSVEDGEKRDNVLKACWQQKLILLPCGERSIRFRLPFVISREETSAALDRVAAALGAPRRRRTRSEMATAGHHGI